MIVQRQERNLETSVNKLLSAGSRMSVFASGALEDEVCWFKLHPPDPIGFMESIDYAAAEMDARCAKPRPKEAFSPGIS
jgi:hypothetical protein